MENFFKTSDFFEASFLVLSGVKILRLDEAENNASKFWYVFENPDRCKFLTQQYWNRKTSVDAKSLADSYRIIQDLRFRKLRGYSLEGSL